MPWKDAHIRRAAATLATLLAVALVLTSCDYGEATGATQVTDISATLNGQVHSSDPLPRYWFEYDPSPSVVEDQLVFGSRTPEQKWACCGPMLSGSHAVSGLTPDTTYQYRFCIRTESGGGLCGAPDTFTTRPADRDVVEGSIGIPVMPELGAWDGVSISVRAEPDSSSPVGTAARLPGSHYFRFEDSGDAGCLRISGNRAAVGFVAEDPTGSGGPDIPQVVFVEDNGPTGDRFGHIVLTQLPSSCPDPSTAPVTWKVATVGDVTVTDHVPLG